MIKQAIKHIYGLSPARMLWIYKQILLPRITYGSLVLGHSLTQEHKGYIRTGILHLYLKQHLQLAWR